MILRKEEADRVLEGAGLAMIVAFAQGVLGVILAYFGYALIATLLLVFCGALAMWGAGRARLVHQIRNGELGDEK